MSPPTRSTAQSVLGADVAELDLMAGLQRLLQAQVAALLQHARPAGAGHDPEALHQTRIAIRRLRVLLRAFRKRLKPTGARQLDRDLQRLNRALGRVRDADVWLARLQDGSWPPRLVQTRSWQELLARHRGRRRRQQATLRRLLGAAALAGLRRRFDRLLQRELPRAARQARPRTLADGARRALRRHVRQARKAAAAGAGDSLAEQHRLRIALRRLRYLAAFFAPLLGPEIAHLLRRTHAADRALGELRDAALALDLLAPTTPTPRRLLAHLRTTQKQAAREWAQAWRDWRDPAFQQRIRGALRR